MKSAIRLSILTLLFGLCIANRGSAQTISGSGVIYSAAASSLGPHSAAELAANAANFSANATMNNGSGSGTIVVDFAATTFSGFVNNIVISAPNSKGVVVTTVTSNGYLTVNASKAQTLVKSVAVFVLAPGSRGSLSLMLTNYTTGAPVTSGAYNIITGGVGVVR